MYTVDLIETKGDLIAAKEEWEALLNHAPSHEYHHHPDNILLLMEHLYGGNRLRAFLIRENGKLCGVAPFTLMKGRFTLGIGGISLLNMAVRQYKLMGTCLVMADDAKPGRTLKALSGALSELRHEYDLIYLESLSYDSPLYTLDDPLPGLVLYPVSVRKNVVRGLKLSRNFAEYLATFRKKRRYNLKRNLRLLDKVTHGDYSMEKVTDAEQVGSFLEAVDHIYERCWQRHSYGPFHHSSEGNVAYHKEIARLGWLRSYLLYCHQKPVAYVIGYQYRGRYYYEYIGYDQAWNHVSPGTVLTYLMIEDLHTVDSPDFLDFGYGENTYKQIFGNYSHEANNSYLVKRISPLRLATLSQLGLSRLYFTLYPLLEKTGLDKRIRKRIRRQ